MIVTVDTKFKKKLIANVKEHVDVLNGNMRTETAWIEIEKVLKLPSKSIQKLWYSFRRQYYEILMNKTIERDDSPSEWELFHDMSFMYNLTKEDVKKNIGGLSPPLLQPLTGTNGSAREPCPCCIPVHYETIEIEDIDSEMLLESPMIINNEAAQSADSMVVGEPIQPAALNESWSMNNQINPSALVSNQEWTQNSVAHSPDSMGLDEGWIINSQVQAEDWITNYEIQPIESTISNPQSDSQIPPPNEALSSDPLNQPPAQASTSVLKKRPKKARYGLNNTLQERILLRTKIITAIQRHPVLYVKELSGPKGTLQDAWNKVTNEIGGSLPKLVIQNRWRLAKQKFVEELLKERYCQNKPFVSKFENFQQMNFMRSHLKSDVDEIDQLRTEIQTIVQKERENKRLSVPTIDLCEDEDDPSPSNQPTQTQNLDCLTLDLTNDEAENSQTFNSDNDDLDSYQKRFEHSIRSVKLPFNESANPTEAPKGDEQHEKAPKVKRIKQAPIELNPVTVFELDYSSDEEEDQKLCEEEVSQSSDSELEMYSEELVYISEPSTTICLDDDD